MTDGDFEARKKMLGAVREAVQLIKEAVPDRERRRAAGALVLQGLAFGFCQKNRITEATLRNNLSLRDLILRELLRKKKIEMRHELLIRHIWGEDNGADGSKSGGNGKRRTKELTGKS
jgi:hypothetical protein